MSLLPVWLTEWLITRGLRVGGEGDRDGIGMREGGAEDWSITMIDRLYLRIIIPGGYGATSLQTAQAHARSRMWCTSDPTHMCIGTDMQFVHAHAQMHANASWRVRTNCRHSTSDTWVLVPPPPTLWVMCHHGRNTPRHRSDYNNLSVEGFTAGLHTHRFCDHHHKLMSALHSHHDILQGGGVEAGGHGQRYTVQQ